MHKLVIAGSRGFQDYELMKQVLTPYLDKIDEIVSGTASGADRLGERFAHEHNIKLTKFPADWDRYGKRAGYIRNEKMAVYATDVIVFWDSTSRGTKHMIDLARLYKRPLTIVEYTKIR